jgi:hypothetical protein
VSLDGDVTGVFVRGRDNAVYYKYKVDGTWKPDQSNWIRLQVVMSASDVVVVARGTRVHVFVVDFDGKVQYLTSDSIDRVKDASWQSLDGQALGNVAAAAQGSERLYVFARQADDNSIYFKTRENSTWSPTWQFLGDLRAIGSAAAVSPSPSRILVVTRDRRNALRAKRWDGSNWYPAATEPWEELGGTLFADVAVATPPDDDDRRVETFHLGNGGALYGRQWDGSKWRPFYGLGGDVVGPPSVFLSDDRLDLYALSASNTIVTKRRTGGGDGQWESEWKPLSGKWTSVPVAHPTQPGVVYARGKNGAPYERS